MNRSDAATGRNPGLPAAPARRVTVTAPANIAFVKYWGARDLARAVPVNPSISMTLSACVSRTTVERLEAAGADEVWLAGGGAEGSAPVDPGEGFRRRVLAHLDALRRRLGAANRYRVTTANSFPAAAGIASSASGFAALAVAVAAVEGRRPAPDELSALARASGSGSASRSVLGGYVEWPAQDSPENDPRAAQLAPAGHWDLRDVIAVVESGAKEVSSLEGHRRAASSPYFARRLELLPDRLARVRRAIAERDFATLGETVEEEAIDLHLVAMSSRPPVYYWNPGTVEVLAAVRALRTAGVPAWSTMDAGANVHVLCPPEAEEAVAERLAAVAAVERLIRDRVGAGPRIEEVVGIEGATGGEETVASENGGRESGA